MKFLFFLFAVGTCQVTWKGKSGKWLVILDEYCRLDTIISIFWPGNFWWMKVDGH